MANEKVATFKERFSELVSSSEKSQTSIAHEFGVAKQTISAWITGQSSPRAPVLTALAEYFDVSVAWLIGYDVPKRMDKEMYKEYEKTVYQYISLPDDERNLLSGYRDLSDTGKSYMFDQLEFALGKYGKKHSEDAGHKIG